MKIVIIGAGVAGLSIAWRLAKPGFSVQVFDGHGAGKAATWAAAGMLAPHEERDPAMASACGVALALWPHFREELEGISGLRLAYRQKGSVTLAMTPQEADRLIAESIALEDQGVDSELVSPPVMSPCAPDARLALTIRADAWVDTRALGPVLKAATTAAGAELKEGEGATRILVANGRAIGVETSKGSYPADWIVLAAGAWSGRIAGLPEGAVPPIQPRKGQILLLESGQSVPPFDPMIKGLGVYTVPRPDGRVIVGATIEDTGFDGRVEAAAIRDLHLRASRLVPVLADWHVAEAWSGLRPFAPDGRPILGTGPVEGLIYATGQYRNGILLAPWIADTISLLILSGRVPSALAPFAIGRFQS